MFEDAGSVVYARSRMKAPAHVVQLTRDGWGERNRWQSTRNCLLPATGRLLVYNPSSDQDLTLSLDASSVVRARDVLVRAGTTEIARWHVAFGTSRASSAPPFASLRA